MYASTGPWLDLIPLDKDGLLGKLQYDIHKREGILTWGDYVAQKPRKGWKKEIKERGYFPLRQITKSSFERFMASERNIGFLYVEKGSITRRTQSDEEYQNSTVAYERVRFRIKNHLMLRRPDIARVGSVEFYVEGWRHPQIKRSDSRYIWEADLTKHFPSSWFIGEETQVRELTKQKHEANLFDRILGQCLYGRRD